MIIITEMSILLYFTIQYLFFFIFPFNIRPTDKHEIQFGLEATIFSVVFTRQSVSYTIYNYRQFLGLFTYNGQTHRPPYTLLPKKYRFTVDIVNVHWPAIFNMMFYCSQQYAHPESGQFWWMLHSHLVKKVKLIKNLSKVMEKRRTTW